MSEPSVHLHDAQLPIPLLRQLYPALVQSPATDWLQVEVACVSCGIRLSPAELRELSEGRDDTGKLQRLRMDYCARNGCESRFYRVSTPSPEAKQRLDTLATPFLVSTRATATRLQARSGPLKIALALAAFGLLLFIIHHLYYGQRIPIIQPRHHYKTHQFAPASD